MTAPLLIVEDDERSRRLLGDLLRFSGYAVLEATSGEAALATLAATRCAAVLLDIQLPGISGFEVLRRIRADSALQWLPVAAVTASVMDHDRQRIMAAGFDLYIPKPIDIDPLPAAVAALVAGRQAPVAP